MDNGIKQFFTDWCEQNKDTAWKEPDPLLHKFLQSSGFTDIEYHEDTGKFDATTLDGTRYKGLYLSEPPVLHQ